MNEEYHYNEQRQPHRLDGPAIIYTNGTKEWYINGKLHRDNDLPAIEYSDGSKAWFINGKHHRESGQPALIYANGDISWRLNGIEYYSEEEYQTELIKLKLNRLKKI